MFAFGIQTSQCGWENFYSFLVLFGEFPFFCYSQCIYWSCFIQIWNIFNFHVIRTWESEEKIMELLEIRVVMRFYGNFDEISWDFCTKKSINIFPLKIQKSHTFLRHSENCIWKIHTFSFHLAQILQFNLDCYSCLLHCIWLIIAFGNSKCLVVIRGSKDQLSKWNEVDIRQSRCRQF